MMSILKIILFVTLLLPIQESTFKELSTFSTIDCWEVYQQARKDKDQQQLKYYYFGIAQPSPTVITKMRTQYHIKVVVLGCMINDKDQICYNEFVDGLLRDQTGKNFYELMADL